MVSLGRTSRGSNGGCHGAHDVELHLQSNYQICQGRESNERESERLLSFRQTPLAQPV